MKRECSSWVLLETCMPLGQEEEKLVGILTQSYALALSLDKAHQARHNHTRTLGSFIGSSWSKGMREGTERSDFSLGWSVHYALELTHIECRSRNLVCRGEENEWRGRGWAECVTTELFAAATTHTYSMYGLMMMMGLEGKYRLIFIVSCHWLCLWNFPHDSWLLPLSLLISLGQPWVCPGYSFTTHSASCILFSSFLTCWQDCVCCDPSSSSLCVLL